MENKLIGKFVELQNGAVVMIEKSYFKDGVEYFRGKDADNNLHEFTNNWIEEVIYSEPLDQ